MHIFNFHAYCLSERSEKILPWSTEDDRAYFHMPLLIKWGYQAKQENDVTV